MFTSCHREPDTPSGALDFKTSRFFNVVASSAMRGAFLRNDARQSSSSSSTEVTARAASMSVASSWATKPRVTSGASPRSGGTYASTRRMLKSSTSTKARLNHHATAPSDDSATSALPRTAVRNTFGHLALTSSELPCFELFGKVPQMERYSTHWSLDQNSRSGVRRSTDAPVERSQISARSLDPRGTSISAGGKAASNVLNLVRCASSSNCASVNVPVGESHTQTPIVPLFSQTAARCVGPDTGSKPPPSFSRRMSKTVYNRVPGVVREQTSLRMPFSNFDRLFPLIRTLVSAGVSVCSTLQTLNPLETKTSTYFP